MIPEKERQKAIDKWCRFLEDVFAEDDSFDYNMEYSGMCSFCYHYKECFSCPLSKQKYKLPFDCKISICATIVNEAIVHANLRNWDKAMECGLVILEGVMTL